jgi:hypothetical protein
MPDRPDAPVITLVGDNVVMSWTAPYDQGSAITAFRVYFQRQDGDWNVDFTFCDGADPTILAAMTCEVPSDTFVSAEYNLAWGDDLYARVEAVNIYGTSLVSASS